MPDVGYHSACRRAERRASGSASAGCRRCCGASCWSTRCRWCCWSRRCSISTSTRTACSRPRCRRCASRRASTPARSARARCASGIPTTPQIQPDLARPLLRRLTEPTPNAQARLYAPDGQLIADSRVREGAGGAVVTDAAAAAGRSRPRCWARSARSTTSCCRCCRTRTRRPFVEVSPNAAGADWQPDVKEELRMTGANAGREMPPYIRRTQDDRLLVTVAEPVHAQPADGRHRPADARGARGG